MQDCLKSWSYCNSCAKPIVNFRMFPRVLVVCLRSLFHCAISKNHFLVTNIGTEAVVLVVVVVVESLRVILAISFFIYTLNSIRRVLNLLFNTRNLENLKIQYIQDLALVG